MSDTVCFHFVVSGKVQGVWYRASTQKKASQLGLTGWVKNLEDGRVELVACGNASVVKQLEAWLHKGPMLAKVTGVDVIKVDLDNFADFSVR